MIPRKTQIAGRTKQYLEGESVEKKFLFVIASLVKQRSSSFTTSADILSSSPVHDSPKNSKFDVTGPPVSDLIESSAR
jgi:hypothetical protein